MRTTLDHLETAADQLAQFLRCAEEPAFVADLAARLGMPSLDGVRIVPAILVSNRMFLGLRIDGFPVRGHYEFEHFVNSASVKVEEHTACFWIGETLTVEDLRRYFEDDITYKPLWNSMEVIPSQFEFRDCTVDFPRWRISQIVLAGKIGLDEVRRQWIDRARQSGVDVDDEGWQIRGGSNDDDVFHIDRESEG